MSVRYRFLIPLLLAVVACSGRRPASAGAPPQGPGASAGPWLQYADAREAGFDADALQRVCEQADRLQSGALMAVFRGHVLLACGDVSRSFEAHSVRKSLVSGLYGVAVARGEIDLDATLAAVGIDDTTPLTVMERSATVRQVIAARSGVYLPAAYAPTSQDRRPERGRHAPGAHWFYNNWDFNVAGVIHERATGEDLYASFDRRLAKPLGMEDWSRRDGFRVYEPTKSRHPAHTFRISTRDLARFGQLYLQNGRWRDRELLPPAWVGESTRMHTDDGDGTGYGYMWWIYRAGSTFTAKYPSLARRSFFRGLGTGEQGLWVMRDAEMVVVHRADTDHGRSVDGGDHWLLVDAILAARRTDAHPSPALRPLQSTPLSSQLPPAPVPEYRALPAAAVAPYLGDYRANAGVTRIIGRSLTPDRPIRVFLFENAPYLHLPGVGDVLLFPTGPDQFTIRAAPGWTVGFTRRPDNGVAGLTVATGRETLHARRVPAA